MSTIVSAHPIGPDKMYEVFGRLNSADILEHVGSILAPNDDLALVRARFICGRRYQELCLAPTLSFIRAAAVDTAAVETAAVETVVVKEF